MKRMLMILLIMAVAQTIMAQDCDNLVADLKKGTLNGVQPTASQDAIKEKLPCFTGDSEDGGAFNCGGGVFFLNHDFFCYTGGDYIEFRKNFNGKLSVPVLGLSQAAAVKKLGLGKVVRQQKDAEKTFVFLKTRYGCLVLTLVADAVTKVGMYAKPAKKVELCL
jgi:hypothetical protein